MTLLSNIRFSITAVLSGVFALAIPQQSMAANTLINSTGVSDNSLFFILSIVAIFQLVAIMVVAGVIKSIVSNRKVWELRKGKVAGVLTLLFVFTASGAMAQPGNYDSLVQMNDTGFITLILLNLFLLAAFIYLASKLNGLLKMLMKDVEGRVPETFLDKINVLLTDAVPLEKEKDVLMDHEYDGIQELDNNLPPWWLYGFYASILFAVIYLVNYHVTGTSPLQIAEYEAAMAEAEAAKTAFVAKQENVVDENNVAMLTAADDLAAGQKNFKLYCGACHGETGGSTPGGVGPNLVDEYWIHGGSINDIFRTIKYGVPEKGMVSWQAQMNPTQIQQLASYIVSIRGTNPENAKEPQGDLWVDPSANAEAADVPAGTAE